MTASILTTRNHSGQVASFYFARDDDPLKQILEDRIRRGELTRLAVDPRHGRGPSTQHD